MDSAFVLNPEKKDEFLEQNNDKFKQTMDKYKRHVLSKPIDVDEFNSNKVSDEFLESCHSAGKIFKQK
jgi:hypothetical protein